METSKTIGDFDKDLPRPAVMCTVVRIAGSAPQRVGARMWATSDRFYGTVGGGALEKKVLEHARELLKDADGKPHIEDYDLTKEEGQVCGGRVEVFFEPVPRRKAVHLFGGGHVGRATAQVLSGMPFDVHVIDQRPEWASREGLPADVEPHCVDPVEYAEARRWTADDAVCVFTHDHKLDFPLARHFLKQPVGYLGVIGSQNKSRTFRAKLKELSEGPEDWDRLWDEKMHCPIGLPLPSKDPKIIAVAVAAELLQEWGLRTTAEPIAPAAGRR
ncbi:MAG: xanthine dehydrogenase accessory protein XdhC [Elusimicrobiota bacterium]